MRKKVEDLSLLEWNELNKSGMLWELYPEAPSTWHSMYPDPNKCWAKDCDRVVGPQYRYCSIECACYDGALTKKGWVDRGSSRT